MAEVPHADVQNEKQLFQRIHKEINELPAEPSFCEGKIRDLHQTIFAMESSEEKEQLLRELKASSFKGLSQELSKMVNDEGLNMESLHLVLKYLTKKNELAEYLFVKSTEIIEQDGLGPVKWRLGPKLEVLGGLISKGIDVNKQWVQDLVKIAPSKKSLAHIRMVGLESFCEGATPSETEGFRRIVSEAEFQSIEKPPDDQTLTSTKPNTNNKTINKEKLKQAKIIVNKAKELAAKGESEAAKKVVNAKIDEISTLLELPLDWKESITRKTPNKLLEELDGRIKLFNNAVEPNEPYKSDYEVVQKASGGRALCAIYYSKYRGPSTAERPLIVMPSKVMLSSPNNSHQIRYLKFSASRAAENYVQTVKSSSTNVGFGIGGFYELFVGEVRGNYGKSKKETSAKLDKKTTNNASVVQYIWTATKTFKIDQEQFIISASARKHAKMLSNAVNEENKERIDELALSFLNRYGSHLPAGLHTLGGILFRIVDAQSRDEKSTHELTEKAAKQLQCQMSFGAYGINANVSGESGSGEGRRNTEERKHKKTSYTFTSQTMGPAATDPATFTKLLGNNSTWALIDRGSPGAYIPVWELISDLGLEFKEAAKALQRVFTEKENKLKKKSIQLGMKLRTIIEEDVESHKNKSLEKNPDEISYAYLPSNGAQLVFRSISTIDLTRQNAYDLAEDKINEDPRHRVCAVSLCSNAHELIISTRANEKRPTMQIADGPMRKRYQNPYKDDVAVQEIVRLFTDGNYARPFRLCTG